MAKVKRENGLQGKSDIVTGGWIETILPANLRPYVYLARLDRPIGVWLLLLPGLSAIALASERLSSETYILFGLFFIGAVLMRAAGCVINDMWDRRLDQKVERTRQRPLASGTVPLHGAVIFLTLLLFGALAVLMQMNSLTIWLGVAVLPFIFVYPFMKRITWWPQAFLGLTFNFSALMGWSAAVGELSFVPLALYVATIFWTLGYDTIYAFQDAEDDALAGIKSTALRFGRSAKRWVGGFYALSVLGLLISFYIAGASMVSYIALGAFAVHVARQLCAWRMDDARTALAVFKSNQWAGGLMFCACLIA